MNKRTGNTSGSGDNIGRCTEGMFEIENPRIYDGTTRRTLNSVRESIRRMNAPSDMLSVAQTIRKGLADCGTEFVYCGVNVIDDTGDPKDVFVYDTEGNASWDARISHPDSERGIDIWRGKTTLYRRDLASNGTPDEWIHDGVNAGITIRSVVDAPFSHGVLSVGGAGPDTFSPKDIVLIESLADILSDGFRRMEDLQKHESLAHRLDNEISRHEQTEEALRESEKRYRILFNSLTDAIIVHSIRDGKIDRIIEANEAALHMCGKPREELLAGTNLSNLSPVERERVAGIYENIIRKGHGSFETCIEHADGGVIPLEVTTHIFELGSEKLSISSGRSIAERIENEKAIRESESRYRRLVENSPDIVYIYSTKRGALFWSSRVRDILGLSPGEIEEIPFIWRQSIHPDDIDRVNEAVEGQIDEVEYRIKNAQGEWRWFHDRVINREKHEEETIVEGLATDITARRQAEEDLRNSELLHRSTLDSISDAIHVIDRDYRIVMHNAELERWHDIFGITKDIDGRRLDELYEKYSDAFFEEYRTIMESGCPILTEDMTEIDGRRIFTETRKIPVMENGKVVRIITNMHDITERKETEYLLRRSEERYRLLAENAPVGILLVGADGSFRDFNNKFLEIMDRPSPENARTINMFTYAPLIKAGISACYRKVLEDGIISVHTRPYTTIKGRNIFVRFTIAPLYENGAITGLMSMIEDISEQKRLEEQIQIRQRMDSLGSLAGGIAHDFNNILTGIMGNLDMLRYDIDMFSENHRENILEAYSSSKRAAKLIHDFQALTNRSLSEMKSIDLHEIAREVFSILERTTDKLITKSIDFPPGRYFVNGNSSQIHQVLLNLGTNAAYAIEQKGAVPGDRISVSAEEATSVPSNKAAKPGEEFIHIRFSDTGIGMSEEVKLRAFEPLFTTKNRSLQKGQGLGLAMVYIIVTGNHEGHIDIESTEGAGTTFNIYLPKAEGNTMIGEAASKKLASRGTETILVIEDEHTVLKLAERALKHYGYTVLTAMNGVEGLEVFENNRETISLVLLDLTMPHMSGKEVIERLLDIDEEVKIIITSGHSDEEIRKYIQAKDFISKPYKLEDLTATIRKVLDGNTH